MTIPSFVVEVFPLIIVYIIATWRLEDRLDLQVAVLSPRRDDHVLVTIHCWLLLLLLLLLLLRYRLSNLLAQL